MSRELKNPRIKEALLQETVNGKVRCLTCERYCQIAEAKITDLDELITETKVNMK